MLDKKTDSKIINESQNLLIKSQSIYRIYDVNYVIHY